VSLQARGYDYGLRVGAYPIDLLRRLHQLLSDAERRATYWVTIERLRRMREGFDCILERLDLTYDDLRRNSPANGGGESLALDQRFDSAHAPEQDLRDVPEQAPW
jgi:hypothetical protein